MTGLLQHSESPLARAAPQFKIAAAFAMSVLTVLGDSVGMLTVLTLAALIFFCLCRPNRSQVKVVTVSLLMLTWGMMFSQGLFYNRFPRRALLVILPPGVLLADGLKIYAEGIRHGLVQSLRIMATGLIGYAICFSTSPNRFMRGLLALRLPYSLAFMAVSAIRFLPVAAAEFRIVRTAMRLKGYRPFRRGLRDTVRVEVASLRPVLAGAIRRSQEVALSIQTRGFSLDSRRTAFEKTRLSPWQWGVLAGLAALVLAAGVAKTLFWLYQWELFYAPELRPLYAFVRRWM